MMERRWKEKAGLSRKSAMLARAPVDRSSTPTTRPPAPQQGLGQVGADVSGAAGDETEAVGGKGHGPAWFGLMPGSAIAGGGGKAQPERPWPGDEGLSPEGRLVKVFVRM